MADVEMRGPTPSEAQELFRTLVNETQVPDGDVAPTDRASMLTRLGMTAHELSAVTGVPVSSIENYVSGRTSGSDALLGPVLKKAATVAKNLDEYRRSKRG